MMNTAGELNKLAFPAVKMSKSIIGTFSLYRKRNINDCSSLGGIS